MAAAHEKWTKQAVEAKVTMDLFMESVTKQYPDALKNVDMEMVSKLPFVANRKDVRTAPPDPRFPNMNQTANCWTKFNTFIMCMNHFEGSDRKKCGVHRRSFKELCPDRYTSQWIDQIEAGNWVGIAPKDSSIFDAPEE